MRSRSRHDIHFTSQIGKVLRHSFQARDHARVADALREDLLHLLVRERLDEVGAELEDPETVRFQRRTQPFLIVARLPLEPDLGPRRIVHAVDQPHLQRQEPVEGEDVRDKARAKPNES